MTSCERRRRGTQGSCRLGERHGAPPRELQQRRSVETAEHNAEASVERHLAEYLRRRQAGGEDRAGHPSLLLAEPRRETFLEQFYDLTWRPGVDVRRAALADLLPERSPHRPSSRRPRPNTHGGQKRTLPRSWLPAKIVACPRPRRLPESRSDARLETSEGRRPSAGYLPFWIRVIVKPLSPLSASNLTASPTLTCLSIARSLTL